MQWFQTDPEAPGMTKAAAEAAAREQGLSSGRRATFGAVPLEKMERPVERAGQVELSEGEAYLKGIGGQVNARATPTILASGAGEGAFAKQVEATFRTKDFNVLVQMDTETGQWRSANLSPRDGKPIKGSERTGPDRASLEAMLNPKPKGPPVKASAVPVTSHGTGEAPSARRTPIGGEPPPLPRLAPGRTYTVTQNAPDLDMSAGEQLTLVSSKGNAHVFRTPGGSTVPVEATPARLLEVLQGEGEHRRDMPPTRSGS